MKKTIAFIVAFAPSLVLAQTSAITDVNSLASKTRDIINLATYFLVAIAVLFIVYNIVFYFIRSTEERGKHGMNILWGIVGLFLILSIWGLVNILLGTFQTQLPTKVSIPSTGNINSQNGPNGQGGVGSMPVVQ